jgi:hypothetical protein
MSEPHTFCEDQTRDSLKKEIVEKGFFPDPFLQKDPIQKSIGLNIAMSWPLPTTMAKDYRKLAKALEKIDSGLYVYPYLRTHVTIATLVNFKEHIEPSKEEIMMMKRMADEIAARIIPLFDVGSTLDLKPFTISVGPPVLSSRAAFLPMQNPTGEILRLRTRLSELLPKSYLSSICIPTLIHSTFLRFRSPPRDAARFSSEFDRIASTWQPREATIDEFLLTSETKPYMMGGKILHRFMLGQQL